MQTLKTLEFIKEFHQEVNGFTPNSHLLKMEYDEIIAIQDYNESINWKKTHNENEITNQTDLDSEQFITFCELLDDIFPYTGMIETTKEDNSWIQAFTKETILYFSINNEKLVSVRKINYAEAKELVLPTPENDKAKFKNFPSMQEAIENEETIEPIDRWTDNPIKLLSYGAGQDSETEYVLNSEAYAEVIFSDTGSEQPETYNFLAKKSKKFNLVQEAQFTVLGSNKLGNIYDYYFNKHIQPIPARRDCTDKFKIRPIRRYLRNKYGKDAKFEMAICINYDEADRMRNDSGVKYMKLSYPLVDKKITRDQESQIILTSGGIVPIKSGCYFCPYTTVKGWTKLRLEHPDLYENSVQLQKNSTLKKKFIRFNENETLDNVLGCSCFNGNFATNDEDETMKKTNGW